MKVLHSCSENSSEPHRACHLCSRLSVPLTGPWGGTPSLTDGQQNGCRPWRATKCRSDRSQSESVMNQSTGITLRVDGGAARRGVGSVRDWGCLGNGMMYLLYIRHHNRNVEWYRYRSSGQCHCHRRTSPFPLPTTNSPASLLHAGKRAQPPSCCRAMMWKGSLRGAASQYLTRCAVDWPKSSIFGGEYLLGNNVTVCTLPIAMLSG